MSTPLIPGDKVQFISASSGLKLRGVVGDTLGLKSKGEELLVPVVRPRSAKRPSVLADHEGKHRELKTRWLKRSDLRKLPK